MSKINFVLRTSLQALATFVILSFAAVAFTSCVEVDKEMDRNWNHAFWDGCKRDYAVGTPSSGLTWIYKCPEGPMTYNEMRMRVSPNRAYWISQEKK
jgi:hypothetical protein